MSELETFLDVVRRLHQVQVRFAVIGVSGVNLYARSATSVFSTRDRDLFLPPDPDNALRAWRACRNAGLELWCGHEPLGAPLDGELARAVVERRALVKALDGRGLEMDLTMVMAGFEFADVWAARRTFAVHGVEIPVARLQHIVRSKALADRPKDRLFLASFREAVSDLLDDEPDGGRGSAGA